MLSHLKMVRLGFIFVVSDPFVPECQFCTLLICFIARRVLGRVIGDRALAQIAFGTKDPGLAKHAYAFSSRQDLMSDFADEEIKHYLGNHNKHGENPAGSA